MARPTSGGPDHPRQPTHRADRRRGGRRRRRLDRLVVALRAVGRRGSPGCCRAGAGRSLSRPSPTPRWSSRPTAGWWSGRPTAAWWSGRSTAAHSRGTRSRNRSAATSRVGSPVRASSRCAASVSLITCSSPCSTARRSSSSSSRPRRRPAGALRPAAGARRRPRRCRRPPASSPRRSAVRTGAGSSGSTSRTAAGAVTAWQNAIGASGLAASTRAAAPISWSSAASGSVGAAPAVQARREPGQRRGSALSRPVTPDRRRARAGRAGAARDRGHGRERPGQPRVAGQQLVASRPERQPLRQLVDQQRRPDAAPAARSERTACAVRITPWVALAASPGSSRGHQRRSSSCQLIAAASRRRYAVQSPNSRSLPRCSDQFWSSIPITTSGAASSRAL